MEKTQEVSLELVSSNEALESQERGRLSVMMEFAQKHPRSITQFHRDAISMATASREIAEKCFYALPRGKNPDGTPKFIDGESIRMAEIAQSAFKYVFVNCTHVAIEEQYVVAHVQAMDMQAGSCIGLTARRRITDRNGLRFNADMIGMTCNAATSIAIRNGIFRIVPKALLKPVIDAAKALIRGDLKTLPERRQSAIEWFREQGIHVEALCVYLGIKGAADIDLDKLVTMAGIRNRIEDEGKDVIGEILAGAHTEKSIFNTEKKPESAPAAPAKPAEQAHPAPEAGNANVAPTAAVSQPQPKADEHKITPDKARALLTEAWPKLNTEQKGEILDGITLTKCRMELLQKVLLLPDDQVYEVLNRATIALTPGAGGAVKAEPDLKALFASATAADRLAVKSGTGAKDVTLEAFEELTAADRDVAIQLFTKHAAEHKK